MTTDIIISDVTIDDYKKIHSCEFCRGKTYPTLTHTEAEKKGADVKVGAVLIRKSKMITGQETRRSFVCYQCMRTPGIARDININANNRGEQVFLYVISRSR